MKDRRPDSARRARMKTTMLPILHQVVAVATRERDQALQVVARSVLVPLLFLVAVFILRVVENEVASIPMAMNKEDLAMWREGNIGANHATWQHFYFSHFKRRCVF